MIGYTQVFTGFSLTILGRLDEAWKCAEEALQITEKYNHPDLESAAHRLMGDIFRYLMNFEAAAENYRNGWECNKDNFVGLDNLGRLGHVLCKIGKKEEGLGCIHRSYQTAKEIGLGTVVAATQLYEMEIFYPDLPIESTLEKVEKIILECQEQSIVSQGFVAIGMAAYLKKLNGRQEEALIDFNQITHKAQELKDPWSEIAALNAIIRIGEKQNPENVHHAKRVQILLKFIESNSKRPELIKSFEKFKNIIDTSPE